MWMAGKAYQEIAGIEGVNKSSICRSIQNSLRKINRQISQLIIIKVEE